MLLYYITICYDAVNLQWRPTVNPIIICHCVSITIRYLSIVSHICNCVSITIRYLYIYYESSNMSLCIYNNKILIYYESSNMPLWFYNNKILVYYESFILWYHLGITNNYLNDSRILHLFLFFIFRY